MHEKDRIVIQLSTIKCRPQLLIQNIDIFFSIDISITDHELKTSRYPNGITSSISLIPRLIPSSALLFLSDTPHIHLTILISILLSLATCSVFAAQVSLPYSIALHIHAAYTLLFSLNATFLLEITCTTTTVYFNEVVFPSVLGSTSPMAFPQHSPPP